VPEKIIKLVGLKNTGKLTPINLITSAVTQNGE
jgi:50S ribosomal subunit-associated GTPase HflX